MKMAEAFLNLKTDVSVRLVERNAVRKECILCCELDYIECRYVRYLDRRDRHNAVVSKIRILVNVGHVCDERILTSVEDENFTFLLIETLQLGDGDELSLLRTCGAPCIYLTAEETHFC